ncbi:MAG: GspE/PulE family protein [Oscillospiraceae bacterium]
MAIKNVPIGAVLKEYGYITEEQIGEALAFQKTDEGKGKRLGDLLLELGFVTEMQVLEALGKKLELPLINLEDVDVDEKAVAKIPKNILEKYSVLPIKEENGRLTLAMCDPLDFYAQEDIKQIANMPLEIVLCNRKSIDSAIDFHYAEIAAKKATEQAKVTDVELEMLAQQNAEDEDTDAPAIRLINTLLARGYSTNVSDIHIEPFETHTMIRMRIDGLMVEYATIARSMHSSLVARVKIMGNLDIAERRMPQDGNFRAIIDGFDISIRVSVIPTVYGEKVVMRYLSSDTAIDKMGHFGMEPAAYEKVLKMINAPNGMVYITGPTGSGKTTTLYMILEELAKRPINISTIEDPVERRIAKVNQMQTNNAAGITFGVGLRALLRQDPDVIMLGETRDAETAETSIRAAITGHLVLSTLHTNDAVSSIARLEDMGVPAYMVANSLVGIVAQRLVRKVCQNCAYETEPSPEEAAVLGDGITRIRKGRGCRLCNNTGYKGRVSIHEIVYIDKTLKRMIAKGAESEEMQEYARNEQGMKTLYESAVDLVRQGITTPDEVLRVAYYSD